jgi:serine/threonine protein kinase
MGTVWRARHRDADAEVALKVISAGGPQSAVESVKNEAQAAAALRHPGIVHLLDYGSVPAGHPVLPSGSPWLARVAEPLVDDADARAALERLMNTQSSVAFGRGNG